MKVRKPTKKELKELAKRREERKKLKDDRENQGDN